MSATFAISIEATHTIQLQGDLEKKDMVTVIPNNWQQHRVRLNQLPSFLGWESVYYVHEFEDW